MNPIKIKNNIQKTVKEKNYTKHKQSFKKIIEKLPVKIMKVKKNKMRSKLQ